MSKTFLYSRKQKLKKYGYQELDYSNLFYKKYEKVITFNYYFHLVVMILSWLMGK